MNVCLWQATGGGMAVLGLGALAPDAGFLNMMTTFSLAGKSGLIEIVWFWSLFMTSLLCTIPFFSIFKDWVSSSDLFYLISFLLLLYKQACVATTRCGGWRLRSTRP